MKIEKKLRSRNGNGVNNSLLLIHVGGLGVCFTVWFWRTVGAGVHDPQPLGILVIEPSM